MSAETEELKKSISEFVKRMRIEMGMTQRELAEASGLNSAYINHIECSRRLATITNLSKLADTLDCSIDEIIGRRIQ